MSNLNVRMRPRRSCFSGCPDAWQKPSLCNFQNLIVIENNSKKKMLLAHKMRPWMTSNGSTFSPLSTAARPAYTLTTAEAVCPGVPIYTSLTSSFSSYLHLQAKSEDHRCAAYVISVRRLEHSGDKWHSWTVPTLSIRHHAKPLSDPWSFL